MKANKIKSIDKIRFRLFKESDTEAVYNLIVVSFSKFDPMGIHLKFDYKDFKEIVRDALNNYAEIIVVAEETDTKRIVGCEVGMPFRKLNIEGNEAILKDNTLEIDISQIQDKDTKTKLDFIELLDVYLMKDFYYKHKKQGDLNKIIFTDNFCVHEDYFGSLLSEMLFYNYCKQLKEHGYKHMYGIVHNDKADTINKKVLKQEVVKSLKIALVDGDKRIKEFTKRVICFENIEFVPRF